MPMDRDNRGPRGRKRRKVCAFCVDKVECIDYKDASYKPGIFVIKQPSS